MKRFINYFSQKKAAHAAVRLGEDVKDVLLHFTNFLSPNK